MKKVKKELVKKNAAYWLKKKRPLTNVEFLEMLFSIRQKTGLKDAVKFIHANR